MWFIILVILAIALSLMGFAFYVGVAILCLLAMWILFIIVIKVFLNHFDNSGASS